MSIKKDIKINEIIGLYISIITVKSKYKQAKEEKYERKK